VLQTFIGLKNPSSSAGFEPLNIGSSSKATNGNFNSVNLGIEGVLPS
jgi:hypothetical protein